MLPKDVFARSIEYPKDFPEGVLDIESYFQFRKSSRRPDDYVLSVVSRFQLFRDSAVHLYGEAVVKQKNERHLLEKGFEANPLKKYVGFYDSFAETFLSVGCSHYVPRIKWRPEHGATAHFQYELYPVGAASDKERKKDRRRVREALYDGAFGPVISPAASSDPELSGCISCLEVKARPA